MQTYPLITYPNEFSRKRILVNNTKEMVKLIELNNFRTKCFARVYAKKDPIEVDKLFIDMDEGAHEKDETYGKYPVPLCYDETIILHERLMIDNLAHRIHFSGRGFSFFVFTKRYSHIDNDYIGQKLRASRKQLAYELHYCERTGIDTARLFRILNTWNREGGRFCIPLNKLMLYSGYENIKELAKEPQMTYTVFGKELFDINSVEVVYTEIERVYIDIQEETIDSKFLLPCAIYIMNMVHPNHNQKVILLGEIIKYHTLGQDCDKEILIKNIENFVWKNCKWADLNNTVTTRNNIRCAVNKMQYGYACEKKKGAGVCVQGCKYDEIK